MNYEDIDLIYWIWLSQIKNVGPVTVKALLNVFNTPDKIYHANKEEILNLKNIKADVAHSLLNSKSLTTAETILDDCIKHDINILTFNDSLYEQEIRDIKEAPVLLYFKGEIIHDSIGVAIIGTRRCTEYGKKATIEVSQFLAENNIPVVSGMAKGIDGYAHTSCIKASGYTIAILGCGVDICYPKEHASLMQAIIENGAVISEYPPGTQPHQKNFPRRNRLISAWCKNLLVVEAGVRSGGLITAAYAKKQKRRVFALPSSIYSREGIGTNKLIEAGARIYLEPSQLLEGFSIQEKCNYDLKKHNKSDLKPLEKVITNKIKNRQITLSELLIELNEFRKDILETVSVMELEGKIITVGGVLRLPEA